MTNYLFRSEVPADKSAFTVAEVLAATAVAIHGSAGPLQGATESTKLPPSLKRRAASQVHREVLMKAISDGAIVLRSPLTGTECELGKPADDGYRLMTRAHFKALCELLSIELVSPPRPHFVTSARPLEVPPELLALAPDVLIIEEHRIGRQNGAVNGFSAGVYRELIEERIARQAEDLFTVNEAAQVLADARPGKTGIEWVKEFRAGHCAGALPIRESGSRIPFKPANPSEHAQIPNTWTARQEAARDFQDLVKGTDLDAWLRSTAGYGFPAAGQLPASKVETPKQRRA